MLKTRKTLGGILATVILIATSFVATSVSPASATSANPSVTSAGYIYMPNEAGTGIDRYNIYSGTAEVISLADASCQALDRNAIFETVLDPANFKLYWTNSSARWPANRTQINVLDLKTGNCSNVFETSYTYVTNEDYFSYRGLVLDQVNQVLYFVDAGGAQTIQAGTWQNKNRSLHWFELASSTDNIIEITQSGTNTLGYATDLTLDGEYVYITGQTYSAINARGSGYSIFKVRVKDGSTMRTASGGVEVYQSNNVTDINQIEILGDSIYFESDAHTAIDQNASQKHAYGGLLKLSKSNPGAGATQVVENSWWPSSPTGFQTYAGFAIGQNNEIFSIDSPDSNWGNPVFWVSNVGSNPVTSAPLAGPYKPNGIWNYPVYNSAEIPGIPSVGSVTRDPASTTASMIFTAPSNADTDGNYEWSATPDGGGSDITGTCTASPCEITGLTSGATYTFSLKHNYKTASGTTIISSRKTNPMASTAPASEVTNTFAGFKTMRSALSAAQKSAIRAWINANPNPTNVGCKGQVGYNWANVSQKELKSLALGRAKAVCAYIKKLKPSIQVGRIEFVKSKSKNSSIRNVLVVLR